MTDELPEGWAIAHLSECVEVLDSRRVPVNADERAKRHGSIPYYGATCQVGWIDDSLFNEELLLLGEDGAPFLDKSKPIAYLITGRSWVNNHAHVLRSRREVTNNRYMKHVLDSTNLFSLVTGTTRLKLTQSAMNTIPVPLAPAAEQTRIVEKVDALLARIDGARERLTRVLPMLQRFRRSILAAACSGELTADWRTAHASGASGHWCTKRLGDVFLVATGGTPLRKNGSYYNGGMIPWVKSGAVNAPVVFAADEFITEKALAETNAKVFAAGTLLVAMYGEGATRGKVSELGIAAATNQAVAAILFDATNVHLRSYLKLFLSSRYVEARETSAGGVQPNLSLKMIRDIEIPFPPVEEQHEIVRRVTQVMALADAIEERVTHALRRAERLPRAILAKAFAGELVPTEAELARQEGRDYETASALLERVCAERAAAPNPTSRDRLRSARRAR